MPRPDNWTELVKLNDSLASAKLAHRAALANFTKAADKMNRALLEQHDYYQYITNKGELPTWLKELSTKKWMFEPKHIKKPRLATGTAKKKIADKLFSNMMKGFKP
jgi:hypothetical protein